MIVVDTTVLIDLLRRRENIKEKFISLHEHDFFISEISIAELYDGLGYTRAKMGEDLYEKKKKEIELLLNEFHTIPITSQILKISGEKLGELRALGKTQDFEDIIIGVSAEIQNSDFLLSRNEKHFKFSKIKLINYKK